MHAFARRSWLVASLLAIAVPGPWAATAWAAKPKGLCAAATDGQAAPPYLVVLSAFPAELAPLVAAAEIESTIQIDARQYYVGRLDGVSVVLGLMGIGVVNARTAARSLLASLDVAGLLVSGVAGSPQRIGDVVLATDWVEGDDAQVFPVNGALFALAERGGAALPTPLESCTLVPPGAVDAHVVCMPYQPTIVFGGHGVSNEDFGSFPCVPGGGDVYGCELPTLRRAATGRGAIAAAQVPPDVEDMESAAVAGAAAEHRVPFLAVRAVSDGAGDPLGDRGFPYQFADYYRLASQNAGTVTHAIVGELGSLGLARDGSARRICRLLTERRWRRAAKRIARR
ncbi:MAG: hypothetical protein ACREQL_03300 [Candidatus Binatia bacterium]